jgi:hypothetical protein
LEQDFESPAPFFISLAGKYRTTITRAVREKRPGPGGRSSLALEKIRSDIGLLLDRIEIAKDAIGK